MKTNRFVFVVPAYNAAATIEQMITSVFAQSYSNWTIIIKDDLSTDCTVAIADATCKKFGIENRVKIHINKTKKWEIQNVLEMIQECDDDDIVCRLDADDWLTDLDVLSILNSRYNELPVDVIWTAHRWGYTNMNISQPLPQGVDVYRHPWVTSHFKTFKKSLLSAVDDENYRGLDGEYFKRIGDQAIYLPALRQAQGRWHFEPIVAYHYTIDMQQATFQTTDARFQRDEAEYLRTRGFIK